MAIRVLPSGAYFGVWPTRIKREERNSMQVIQNKLEKSLIILPIFGIIILSFLYINIYINTTLANSHAINDTDSYSFNLADTTNLSISLPAPETLTLTPSAEGVFGSKSIAVGVSTNSPYGYTLTMSAASSSLSRSAAVGGVTPTIPALETAVSEADFPNNYWGFKRTSTAVADTNYQPMLANHSVLVNNTSANADSSSSTITFGVKLSNETPSGDYSINIDFLAVTNVAPNLYYMQDATSTSLAAAMPSVGDTTVLYDRRDNKEYTIAKLADGKYWMTKNLDLDGGTPLYSSDSDVPAGYDVEPYYTLPASQKIASGTTLDGGFNDDAGEYVFNSSNKTDSCGSGCYSYYSWNAAVAGNKTNVNADVTEGDVDTDAPYSICPAGWKLPTSRHDLTTAKTSSDFYQMAVHYGLNPAYVNEDPDSAPTFCSLAGDGGNCGNKTIPNFLRAGYCYGSTFYNGGSGGDYWSSTASSSANAHRLDFSSGDVYSASNLSRRYGFPVRCLFDATMQNFSQEDADSLAEFESETLVDSRDGNTYTVKKINGDVWMTQNLRFTGTTLTPADSNVSANTTMTYYSLDSSDDSYANHCDSTNGLSNACIKDSGSTETGVWYNYDAASAGTIAGSSNTTPATSSLCPSGWHIPTGPANDISSEFHKLFQSTTDGPWVATNSYLTAFKAVPGGYYANGSLDIPENGDWWPATAYNATLRYSLGYNSSSTQFATGANERYLGFFVRCIQD